MSRQEVLGDTQPLSQARRAEPRDAVSELLGELLLLSGAITEDDLTEALRLQQAQGGRLGDILAGMGVVSFQQVEEALQSQRRLRG